MPQEPPPSAAGGPLRVLIAGGGAAGLEAALALRHLAGPRVAVTLLAPEAEFVYRPLAVIEPFGLGEAPRLDLPACAAEHGWTFVREAVARIDAAGRAVWTAGGRRLPYDAVLLAVGAGTADAVPGALTFRGPEAAAALARELRHLPRSRPTRIAFVAAPVATWTLPLYELALLTARWAAEHAPRLEVWAVTHEPQPLAVFGAAAADAVTPRLEAAGVRLWSGAEADLVEDGRLWAAMEGGMPVDLAVALPAPVGRPPAGVPHDAEGFVPVDGHGRVPGLERVYAAGDMTTRPLRQGGLATAQADAAAASIAALVGAHVDTAAFRPVLHGMLITGEEPIWLLRGAGGHTTVADEPPWWPPHKLAGRYLAPFLAARATAERTAAAP